MLNFNEKFSNLSITNFGIASRILLSSLGIFYNLISSILINKSNRIISKTGNQY